MSPRCFVIPANLFYRGFLHPLSYLSKLLSAAQDGIKAQILNIKVLYGI